MNLEGLHVRLNRHRVGGQFTERQRSPLPGTDDAELPNAHARTYRQVVPLIKRAAQLDESRQTRDWVAQIRARYKSRPKLMGMLDKAGL